MKLSIALLSASITLLSIVTTTHASNFEIIFYEGEYSFNHNLPETDTENKYLAKVIIKKDGIIQNEQVTIKGSTLPDSWFFYEIWHGEGNITPPKDSDIEKIFTEWEDELPSQGDFNSTDPNLYNFINDIGRIIKKASYIPVIYSGRYNFEIGLHQNGQSRYGIGIPHVPRLKGSNFDKPFDGRTPDRGWS